LTALHDHGHFGRAAEACHVIQSTLSARIKELEGVLETLLVDRSKRHVVFTPVGIETVERARGIVKEVDYRASTYSPRRPALT
jgi:LysR family transcriptional regulator, hydrogen peroxide-inducible genes activator